MAAKKCCRHCGFYAYDMIKIKAGSFCNMGHAAKWGLKQAEKKREKVAKKVFKETITKHKQDKEKIKKRSEWYADYRTALHYQVKHIIRKGESCYTCDKPQSFGDSGQAFHVGHYMPAKQVDPRRFMLLNMRLQCYRCNCQLSGNQAVYRKRLIEEMGIDHVEWLECEANHKELKEVFPHYQDIKIEIARVRKMVKEA